MAVLSTFVDSFPVAPVSEVHQKIDSLLRNCDGLWPNAPMGLLFPGCAGASTEDRCILLAAAMERVEWHAMNPSRETEKWLLYLKALANMVSGISDCIDQDTLLRLAKFGPRLHHNQGGGDFHNLGHLVLSGLKVRKEPLTRDLAEALESLVDHLVRIHSHAPSTFNIAFRVFRSGWSFLPWIRMSDMDSPEWNALLNLSDHNWQSGGIAGKPAKQLVVALDKIGATPVAALFNRTVEAMEVCQPTPMSGAGMTMLRQMLRWAQAKPELPVDDALYRLSGIRWDPAVMAVGLMKEWIGTFLQTLALRERDRAFACVERLANNPDTKVFREVTTLYDQYMSEMMRDVPSRQRPGVDGFPIESEWQMTIDSFLQAAAPKPPTMEEYAASAPALANRSTHFELVLRQSKGDYPGMLRAMNERVRWLSKHEPPVKANEGRQMPWLAWCCDLGVLYGKILDRKPKLAASDLTALCGIDALGWLGVTPTGPLLNACEAWISENGFDKDLTPAMQQWQKSVFGGGTAMALRKHIGWLLWFDTAAPINEKACWSALIRKDLRTMQPKLQGAWIALLQNVSFGLSVEPTKKWLKPADKLLKQLDAQEFQSRFRAWFAPFQAGRELKITVAGRDILGALLWYSQLAKDPKVDDAVRWFATAKWKAKSDRDRTARLLPIWLHTMTERSPEEALDAIHAYQKTGQLELMGRSMELYENLCRRYERKPEIVAPPPPPPVDKEAMMSRMMQKAMSEVLGEAAQITGDLVSVSNAATGERYEIGLRDGRIVRLSDNKTVRLEIDWSRPPFSPFKGMIDSGDMMDPFGRNYFRAMLCAQVLSGTLPVEADIVVDEG